VTRIVFAQAGRSRSLAVDCPQGVRRVSRHPFSSVVERYLQNRYSFRGRLARTL
jgi:hypothetical protein